MCLYPEVVGEAALVRRRDDVRGVSIVRHAVGCSTDGDHGQSLYYVYIAELHGVEMGMKKYLWSRL